MAESPLRRLARLLGGVVLTQGRLPHQVLGQLLLLDTDEVAIAGAAVVFAGTTRQRNVFAQAAIRTALPALALRSLFHGEEKRLERLRDQIESKERDIERHARLAILIEQRRRRLGSGGTAAVLAAKGRPGAAVLERAAARSPARPSPPPPPARAGRPASTAPRARKPARKPAKPAARRKSPPRKKR